MDRVSENQAIQQSLERISLLEAAIGSCKCGVTIADATAPDMPLIYINDAFEEITGYSVEETLGKNCRFLQGDDPNTEAREKIREALQDKKDLTVVLRNFRKDGTPFWNELHLSPVMSDGKVTHFIGIQNDITSEVEAKQALKESEASLRESNEEKEKLLGVAAHDLRNPIGLIKSLVDLSKDAGPEESANILSMMEEVADKALQMLGEILSLQAIQTGKVELDLEQIDLKEFLTRYTRSAGHTCALKDMELVTEFGELPQQASFDAGRIERVLDNLLTNAVKYSNRGSSVILSCSSDGQKLRFTIKDQGQGIPEAELPQLFDAFNKISTTPTEGETSSGLGLAISKRLVEMHRGDIEVTSEPGKGSAFTVVIPVAQ